MLRLAVRALVAVSFPLLGCGLIVQRAGFLLRTLVRVFFRLRIDVALHSQSAALLRVRRLVRYCRRAPVLFFSTRLVFHMSLATITTTSGPALPMKRQFCVLGWRATLAYAVRDITRSSSHQPLVLGMGFGSAANACDHACCMCLSLTCRTRSIVGTTWERANQIRRSHGQDARQRRHGPERRQCTRRGTPPSARCLRHARGNGSRSSCPYFPFPYRRHRWTNPSHGRRHNSAHVFVDTSRYAGPRASRCAPGRGRFSRATLCCEGLVLRVGDAPCLRSQNAVQQPLHLEGVAPLGRFPCRLFTTVEGARRAADFGGGALPTDCGPGCGEGGHPCLKHGLPAGAGSNNRGWCDLGVCLVPELSNGLIHWIRRRRGPGYAVRPPSRFPGPFSTKQGCRARPWEEDGPEGWAQATAARSPSIKFPRGSPG